METTTFVEEILRIDPPWYVESAGLDGESVAFCVRLDFERGGTFTCGACGQRGCKAYDTYLAQWRHLDFLGYRTLLYAPAPRVKCPECGIRRAVLPWARPRSRFTHDMEDLVADLASDLPVKSVARVLGEHDTRLGYMLRNRTD